MKICFASIDIESDFGKNKSFQGVERIEKLFDVFKKYGIPLTLFVTGNVLEKYPEKAKSWPQNYEIAFHGYSHKFWDILAERDREKEVEDFMFLFERVLGKKPDGFRSPSHIIDNEMMRFLEKKGFAYDSSVVPGYPLFKYYRGYRGKAPLAPYHPAKDNCREECDMRILEIPVAGILSIPLAGTWISKLPLFVYRFLFALKKPEFLTLSLHSWDSLNDKLILKLAKLVELLNKKGYKFSSGKQIYEQFSKNTGQGKMERAA